MRVKYVLVTGLFSSGGCWYPLGHVKTIGTLLAHEKERQLCDTTVSVAL